MAILCVFRNDHGFVTDLGSSFVAYGEGDLSNEMFVPRYGVWKMDHGKGKHQVVFTSDDLEECKRKLDQP